MPSSWMNGIVDKTRAFNVRFELEEIDTRTEKVLFAMVYDMAKSGVEASWADALALAEGLGKRAACRTSNFSRDVKNRVDCMAIPIKSQ